MYKNFHIFMRNICFPSTEINLPCSGMCKSARAKNTLMNILWAHIFFSFSTETPVTRNEQNGRFFYVLCHIINYFVPVKLVDAFKNEGIWQNNSCVVHSVK